MNTQHTPGPWYVTDIAIIGNNGGTWIAEHPAIKWRTLKSVTNSGDAIVAESIKQANANARLIAAAPQMLEALRAALEAMGDTYDARDAASTEGEQLRDQIAEAIAAATGEPADY